jgi:hypothetical protein
MGKESAPPPPDYSGIAAANEKAAELSYKTGQDQLAWAKEQYADIAPTTKAYLNSMINNSDQQTANAEADRKRYESIYQPVENKFVDTANGWNSADRSNQQAGAAMADVSNTFDQQRKGALSSLESYGIDPSQTRYGALDLGTRVQQAAATAAAGTQSRLQTEATGLALQGEAINIGKGYPSQVAQSYAGATSAGGSGIDAANRTLGTAGGLMGSPTQWMQTGNQANAGAVGALNTGYNNALSEASFNNNVQSSMWGGIGKLAGGALGAFSLL